MSTKLFRYSFFSFLITLYCCYRCTAQSNTSKHYSKQFSITTENDRYMLQGRDGYYTNGIILGYDVVHGSSKKSILKQVHHYELGQRIYMPYSRKIYTPSQIDRPVTGYLYAKFSQSDFFARNRLFQWGVSIGSIGEASLGRQMQNSFHNLINVNSDWWGWVWDYQLKTEPGINLHAKYAVGLLSKSASPLFQITPVSAATLGTSFTNLAQGVLIQFGRFNPQSQGAYWNASVQGSKDDGVSKPELFFYYYPQLNWQAYNATIQGGLFRKDKGPILSSIEPFRIEQEIGAMFARNRYSFRLSAVLQSKEAKTQIRTQSYGSLRGAYLFK